MANKNTPHSNNSQFFITLDKCSWLDKKHTIFGKVVGDTYYNVLNISELSTFKGDCPDLENPPKVLKCEVIINPFPDIFPRKKLSEEAKEKNLKKLKNNENNKQKNYENKNLLSFEEFNEDSNNLNKGIKSSHEMLKNDPKLLNKPVINKEHLENLKNYHLEKEENLKMIKDKVKNINSNIIVENDEIKQNQSEDESSSSRSVSKDSKIINENKEINNIKTQNNLIEREELFSENKKEINNLKKEILKIKQRKDPDEELRIQEELKLYTPLQKMREKYLTKKKPRLAGRETIEKLQKFKDKIKQSEGVEDNWMNNKLKFHVDSQKAYAINEQVTKLNNNLDFDAIEIIDPRKRQLKRNEIENENSQTLNMDKIFNVDDLINKTNANKF